MAGFWSIIYEPLNKKILNYRSHKYATFSCLSKCLNLKPIFLPLSFNQGPNSSKSCYSRLALCDSRLKKKDSTNLGFTGMFFIGILLFQWSRRRETPRMDISKKGSISQQEGITGKTWRLTEKKGRKSTRVTCPWPVLDLSLTYPNRWHQRSCQSRVPTLLSRLISHHSKNREISRVFSRLFLQSTRLFVFIAATPQSN